MVDTRELYSIEEARFVLGGISRATIYDLLNSGELPSV
jgi:predicted DNA-binding transcriptional regulator AlpA